MPLIDVTTLAHPRLEPYLGVADPVLLRSGGRFIAEGRAVVRRLLASPGWRTESVLVSPAALKQLAPALTSHLPGTDVFVASPDLINQLTGFNIHRGCLAVGVRGEARLLAEVVPAGHQAAAIVVLDGVANPDNVGGLFRNALAFGAAGVLLAPGSCDPLYRKAIRTSMGASLVVPFAQIDPWPILAGYQDPGYAIVVLDDGLEAPTRAGARTLGPPVRPCPRERGRGCVRGRASAGGCNARIPMAAGVDSLNAATAGAVALFARRRYVE